LAKVDIGCDIGASAWPWLFGPAPLTMRDRGYPARLLHAAVDVSRFVEPVVLTGERFVRLEPLTSQHVDEIAAAAADGDPGQLWFTTAPSPHTAEQWVRRMLSQQSPDGLTFAVRRLAGPVIGSSSYLNVDAANRRLEIGATWYSASSRRTGANTECKLLMLAHAFDTLGCIAVEFRTHFFNFASRTAIESLGAKLDGILRSHQLLPDGSRRDTVVYSILDSEWPSVRNNLQFRLRRADPPNS
jgi:N-acetyltransferase